MQHRLHLAGVWTLQPEIGAQHDHGLTLPQSRLLDASRSRIGVAPIRSNVTPPLRAPRDRNDPSQKGSYDHGDHSQSDLIRLQPFALPFQEYGKRKPPDDGDFGIEFPAQVRNDAVMAEQVTHQAPKRRGENGRNRAP